VNYRLNVFSKYYGIYILLGSSASSLAPAINLPNRGQGKGTKPGASEKDLTHGDRTTQYLYCENLKKVT
jgi:hypothetical protein